MTDLFRAGEIITREDFRRRLNAIPEYTLLSIHPGYGIQILPTGTGGIMIAATGERKKQNASGDSGVMTFGVSALNADGNTLDCLTWDPDLGVWGTDITSVNKPWLLQKTSYNGRTFTYQDGRVIAYDVTTLDAAYQRRATWTEDGETLTEVQAITPAYTKTGNDLEVITVMAYNGAYWDINTAGRSWARALGY